MGMPGRCMLPQTLRKTKTDNNEISAKKEGEERKPQKRKPQKRKPQERKPQKRQPQKRKPQKRKPQKRKPRPGCCAGARFFFLSAAGGGLRRGGAAQGCELACGTGLRRGAARGPIVPVPSARGISCPPSSQRSIRRAPPRPGADRAASRPDPPACPAECCRAYPAGRGSPHCCWSLP